MNLKEVAGHSAVKGMLEIYSHLNSAILDEVTDEVVKLDPECEAVVLVTMYDKFDSIRLPSLSGKGDGGKTMKHLMRPSTC